MKCNQIRELMPDLAAGLSAVTPEMKDHLKSCTECSGKLEAFRQTMTLLDEWKVPEGSPYFDVRLRARLREEQAKQATGWLQWLRRPARGDWQAHGPVISSGRTRLRGRRFTSSGQES